MSKINKCPVCNGFMIIDTWNGWRWSCLHCTHLGDFATEKEINEQEKEMQEM